MKTTYVVDNLSVAKVLIDPMRRAILDLLRISPMTQAKLADELGLSGPSLNYHMKLLKSKKLVAITKREAEKHGIIQKFFEPAAYLFVYDLDALPKHIARYFYPVSLERTRGIISALHVANDSKFGLVADPPDQINQLSERISRSLVKVARRYSDKEVQYGSEAIVFTIYSQALRAAITN
jgi:DNA-binding transcriptional ArsR family regulator